jgi:hypothetical protein
MLVRKIATTTSSNECTKANSEAVRIDGHISGTMTLKITLAGVAPSTAAARGRFGSMPRSPDVMAMKTSGRDSTLCANTRPATVPTRPTRENTKKNATAKTIFGMTSGARQPMASRTLPRPRLRVTAIAAAEPTASETMTTSAATRTLVPVAASHRPLDK